MWPKSDQNSDFLLNNVIMPGDNTEKIWAHLFFCKANCKLSKVRSTR